MQDQGSICYTKNFLTNVILRIDFLSPIKQIDTSLHSELGGIILKHFPIKEPRAAAKEEYQIKSNIKEPTQFISTKTTYTEWNFYGTNREKQLRITPEYFYITYIKYSTYEILREEFSEVSKMFFKNYPDALPNRLGLRYINEIEIQETDPLDWNRHINANLLGVVNLRYPNCEPTRIFHNYEMLCNPEKFKLRFQYGLFNPDYPAAIKRKTFILDYDAYNEGAIEPNEINQNIDTYHNKIQELFENNITTELREKMNES